MVVRALPGVVALILVACAQSPFSPPEETLGQHLTDDLVVELAVEGVEGEQGEGQTVSPSTPITATVTATNRGDGRVSWGPGSSTCQLGIVVRVGERELYPGTRICTADMRSYRLEPGETRTESISWDGRVWMDGAWVLLDPGVYEMRGAATPVAVSEPTAITVVGD